MKTSYPSGVHWSQHPASRLFIIAAVVCCARSEAYAALETMSIVLASQGPSGDGSDSPKVTLYNANGTVATSAYVSQGGAVNWSNLTYVSGNHDAFAGNPLNSSSDSTFISFCIELTQDISLNSQYTVDLIPLSSAPQPVSGPLNTGSGMGSTPAMLISELWAAHFHDIFYTGSQQNDQATQDQNAAAFQLAIWKLEYDANNLNYSGKALFENGYLQISPHDLDDIKSNSVQLAEQWIADVVGMNGKGAQANLFALTGDGGIDFQDQVVEVLPEPSSMVLWAMGALGMAAIRRGRRRGR